MSEIQITLPVSVRYIRSGVPGSTDSCSLALMARAERDRGRLLPLEFTNVRDINVVVAKQGLNRFPALVCLADYQGRTVRVTATSMDHLAFEVAFATDTGANRENLCERLRMSHHRHEVTFQARYRPVRVGTANRYAGVGNGPPQPLADRHKDAVTDVRQAARNFARRKDVTLHDAQVKLLDLASDSAEPMSAEELETARTSVASAWTRERERMTRGKRTPVKRRSPIRITGDRWLES